MINKPKAQLLRFALLLVLTLVAARSLQAGPDDTNRSTGQLLPPAHDANQGPPPSSQLNEPITVPQSQWGDEAGKTQAQVDFKDLPLVEVVASLRDRFSNKFDVVLPYQSSASWDWADQLITLQLRNVTITEAFNAMNLMWASANTPLRWQLMMNGTRPTALLRILEVPKPPEPLLPGLPPPPEHPMVFFVGDLLGDPKSGGMTMDQLVDTVVEVSKIGIGGEHVYGHNQAQLIIVRGTDSDISFVQNTLAALRQKAQLDGRHKPGAAATVNPATGLPLAPPGASVPAPDAKTR